MRVADFANSGDAPCLRRIMKPVAYPFWSSCSAGVGVVLCGVLAHSFRSTPWLSELFGMPLYPSYIIGYLFIHGDRGENGEALFLGDRDFGAVVDGDRKRLRGGGCPHLAKIGRGPVTLRARRKAADRP